MNNDTKKAFFGFNKMLQRELIAMHPELQMLAGASISAKRLARWSEKAPKTSSPKIWKERILESLDIYQVLEFYGFQLNGQHRCACMFHGGKNENLSTYDRTRYHCFVCGVSGDLITFVMDYFGLSFREALIKIDHDFHMGITTQTTTLEESRQHRNNYLLQKRLRMEHEEFRKFYCDIIELHKVLFCKSKEAALIVEDWLNEYQDMYDDSGLFRKYNAEGRVPAWK